jgi:hypothetical protein
VALLNRSSDDYFPADADRSRSVTVMNKRHISAAPTYPKPRCRRCGRFKGEIYTALCKDCVEQTLRKLLPRLKRILEERYGRQLDKWLDNASFTEVRWDTSLNFTVGERLFQCFLEQLIREAAENKDIWLEFSGNVSWTPTQISQLLTSSTEGMVVS